MDGYRKHHADCIVRHEQSLTNQWKQSQEETMNLKQRYLEAKSIRQVKSAKDKKFVSTDINNSLIPVPNLLSSDSPHMVRLFPSFRLFFFKKLLKKLEKNFDQNFKVDVI